jgi:hypothetical protein
MTHQCRFAFPAGWSLTSGAGTLAKLCGTAFGWAIRVRPGNTSHATPIAVRNSEPAMISSGVRG